MDPVTIGLALAGAKKLVEAAGSIKDIAGGLDNLFSAQEAKPKPHKKKKPKTRMQQILRMRAGDEDYDDETSISSVANDLLQQRQHESAIKSLAREIDTKWGEGTFDLIKKERQKRLDAKADKEKKAKEVASQKAEEDADRWERYAMEALKLVVVIIVIAGTAAYVLYSAQ